MTTVEIAKELNEATGKGKEERKTHKALTKRPAKIVAKTPRKPPHLVLSFAYCPQEVWGPFSPPSVPIANLFGPDSPFVSLFDFPSSMWSGTHLGPIIKGQEEMVNSDRTAKPRHTEDHPVKVLFPQTIH